MSFLTHSISFLKATSTNSTLSSVEHKKEDIWKNVPVVLFLYNDGQWDSVLFGYEHSFKYLLLCFAEEQASYRFKIDKMNSELFIVVYCPFKK